MHHMKLKAAVEKYRPMLKGGASEPEIKEAIANDEKEYSPEDVEEIYTACLIEENAPASAKSSNGKAKAKTETKHTIYEEWRMDFNPDGKEKYKDGNGEEKQRTRWKAEKLKLLRDNVKLSPEMAETLNNNASNVNPIMYFEK